MILTVSSFFSAPKARDAEKERDGTSRNNRFLYRNCLCAFQNRILGYLHIAVRMLLAWKQSLL